MRDEYTPEPVEREINGHDGYVNDRTVTGPNQTLGCGPLRPRSDSRCMPGRSAGRPWGDYDYTQTISTTHPDGCDTLDVERDDIWGFRIGARISHQPFYAFANLALGYETSWTIGLGADF
jgi:hypothetical protein